MGYIGALSLNGGEMQGVLKLQAGQYGGTGPSDEKYGLDCQNSNIIGVNRILSADPAEAPSEGWGFKRSDDPDKYDVIWAADGKLYFTPGLRKRSFTVWRKQQGRIWSSYSKQPE